MEKQDSTKLKDKRQVIKVGYAVPSKHESSAILNPNGISRCMSATDYKHPIRIIEECIGSTQKHAARTDGTEAPTLTASMGKGGGHIPMLKLRESTEKGYAEAEVGDGIATDRTHCKSRRGVVQKGKTGALNCQKGNWGTVTPDYRIRKLTPRECERLQGFPDDWTRYGKDGKEISDTQRYKCLGNAVTTTVITHLINEMFRDLNE